MLVPRSVSFPLVFPSVAGWNMPIFNRTYIFIQGPFSIAILVYGSVTSLKSWHRYWMIPPNRHFGKLTSIFKTHHVLGVYVKFSGCSLSGFLMDFFRM